MQTHSSFFLLLAIGAICNFLPVRSRLDLQDSWMTPPSIGENIAYTYPPAWVERCGKGDESIPLFKESAQDFEACYQKLFNVTTLVEEFYMATHESKVPLFTKRQCAKVPELSKCLEKYAKSVEECFDERERRNVETTVVAMKSALDFICYKDGERISIFLRDEGMTCFSEQYEALYACVSNTSSGDFTNLTTPDDLGFLTGFSFTPETCNHVTNIRQCLFTAFAKCPKRTPSLLFDGFAKTVLKPTPCAPSSANTLFTLPHLILLIATILLCFI